MQNTYWNHRGTEQKKYTEMLEAGWEFNATSERVFYSYYRYFNDGDLPGWARKQRNLIGYEYVSGRTLRKLNTLGEAEQERRLTERIQIEYARFLKANRKPA